MNRHQFKNAVYHNDVTNLYLPVEGAKLHTAVWLNRQLQLLFGKCTMVDGCIYCYRWWQTWRVPGRWGKVKRCIQKHVNWGSEVPTSPGSSFLVPFLTLAIWHTVRVRFLVLFETVVTKKPLKTEEKPELLLCFPFYSTFLLLVEGLLLATSSKDPVRADCGRSLPSTLAKVQLW